MAGLPFLSVWTRCRTHAIFCRNVNGVYLGGRTHMLTQIGLKQVKVQDGFWGHEMELVRTRMIPYQWEALNDRVEDAAPS